MFFTKFPSTKLQDVNLDWLLKKICKLRGGTTNQVLAKASDADFDFKWITGGGGGGTSDYNDLVNQPQINDVTLIGNMSGSDLGLLDATALENYRTATAQDAIDAGKQAKIAASGMLKGDGDGGVTAAAAGTDYLAPAALMPYRTAAAQDTIDAAQTADIATRVKTNELGVVITGARPSMVVSADQYVIVRDSTISGITDGLYIAVNALSPSADVTAANLTAVSAGGLNRIQAAISGLGVSIEATDTVSTTVHDAIVSVLTTAGPQNRNRGIYTGPFIKRGSTPIVAFTGFYSLFVNNPGANYATQGYVIAQGKFFMCWYTTGSWLVTELS